MHKKTICLLFITWSWTILFGLDPSLNITQYNLEVYTTEDGLPQSSILSIIQTRDGYLWLATYEGIARFDGIRFRVFDTSNTPEMASNRVKVFLEDSRGGLWIGTSGGLLRYWKGVFKNYTVKDGLSNNFVVALCEDKKGRLWIGTTLGLNCLENGKFTAVKLESSYISALSLDRVGDLWIGTSGDGLYVYSEGRDRLIYCPVKGLPDKADIRALHKDRDGRMWVGTGDRGAAAAINDEFKFYSTQEGLSGNDVRSIFHDSRGTLWIGTNGQGVNTLKKGKFSFSDSEKGFFNSPIRCFLEDKEGSIWIGTRDGLSQLKDGKFIIYNNRNGLTSDSIRSVFQDREKRIWIGTVGGGLALFMGDTFKTFGKEAGLKSDQVWAIADSSDGSLWIGTYGAGLHRMKNEKILKVYSTENGLSNNIVRAIYADPSDNIWVGTNGGGIDILQASSRWEKIINYSTREGLSDNFVYCISGDKAGNTWIGTYYGNLNRVKDGVITVFKEQDGLPGAAIWSIVPDSTDPDCLWIGTDDGGLHRFKSNIFTRFTMKKGLYSDLAFQVVEDLKGNLWMNCNRGIFNVPKNDLIDFAAGKISRVHSISYGKTEGIKNTECNGPAQPAGICTHDGELWFPTIRGVVVIDPLNIKKNLVLPPVRVEEFRVDDKLIYAYPTAAKAQSLITVPAGKKRFDFVFTALSYLDPDRIRFKYKLSGFDDEWQDAGTRRRVTYTNIDPGRYTFSVIARNSDGLWNNSGDRLDFELNPYAWQTLWFRLLLVVAFAFLSYLLIGFINSHLKFMTFWKKKKYIGSYEIEDQIGMGGMGVVYKVHSLMDRSKKYALKVMRDEFQLDEVQKKRFKNESLLVDRLDHPHIVKVQERGEDRGRLYIAMELLEGQTLAQRFKNNQYPSIPKVAYILMQLAHILVNLHRENIIHRDLKPENIMVVTCEEDPDYVKLMDFGIARVESFSHLTKSGEILGTIAYLPPEVLSDGTLSFPADIYSLGIIGYEMLTHSNPFTSEKPLDAIKNIIKTTPLQPIEIIPGVPSELNDLIMRMIDKDPQARPEARTVLVALAGICRAYNLSVNMVE